MTEKVQDIYKHCFGHVCATGVLTMMTMEEVISTYTESMCKDLEDCGVAANEEKVKEYLAEQYNTLKAVQTKHTNIVRM